jgi:hypothetical protein
MPLIFAIAVSGMAMRARGFQTQRSNMTPGSSDAELTERLAQAAIVVSGVVLDVSPQNPALGRNHDPAWSRATIQVETVEKGAVSTKTVDVLYSNSHDTVWDQSPKIAKGEHGVWLLQTTDPRGLPAGALAVVHPLDRHPIAELPKVRALLQNANPK